MHPPTDRVTQTLSSLDLVSMDSAEYSDIFSVVKGVLDKGRLKLRSDSILFQSSRTAAVDRIPAREVQQCEWMKVAKGYELKFLMESGKVHKFDGFKESEFTNLSEFIKHNYNSDLEEVALSVKGWNWGNVKFIGSLMKFSVEEKTAFEIPLSQVSQCTKNKSEVVLEFHQSDEAPVSLVEMRFHVPTNQEDEHDPVKNFHDQVLAKADVLQATVDAYAIFDDVPCLTPRGHYTVKAYPTFFQLHGKTFNYNIPYNTIIRLFLLPNPDGIHMFIVKYLEPPIRQGQTRHNFVIQNYTKEDMCGITLTIPDEDLATKFNGRLTRTMSGPTYEVYARILKELVGRKITVPGSYTSRSGAHAIHCALRANPGLLYPLEKAFLFIHKPPLLIRFDEVATVNFARVSGGGTIRSFDFEVETRNGTSYTFSNIAREDYPALSDFVTLKKLPVKNKGQRNIRDSIHDGIDDSDNDETDHYLEQMKAEGQMIDSEDEDSSYAAESEKDDHLEYNSDATISDQTPDSADEQRDNRPIKHMKEEKEEKVEKEKKEKSKSSSKRKEKRSTSEKPRKSKKNKDPNQPKKPISAYMIWYTENRKNIVEKYGLSASAIGESGKKGGELWGKMTGEDKQPYVAKYEEAKKKYDREMKDYQASGGGADIPTSSRASKPSKGGSKSGKKRSTPKKGTPQKTFKSKEFVSTEDDESSDSAPKKKEFKQKLFTKEKKKPTKDSSSVEEMDIEPEPKPKPSRGSRSTRSKANEDELVALPSGSDYEESIASDEKSNNSKSGSASDSDL